MKNIWFICTTPTKNLNEGELKYIKNILVATYITAIYKFKTTQNVREMLGYF